MGKYLDFYNRCIKIGRMPNQGLCNCAFHIDNMRQELEDFFTPEGELHSENYWAYDPDFIFSHSYTMYITTHADIIRFAFTPLRQNIVLLLAAMNDEL